VESGGRRRGVAPRCSGQRGDAAERTSVAQAAVRAALVAAVTLVPVLAECPPTLAAVRERLGVSEVLVELRSVAALHLGAMAAPVGFRARARKRREGLEATPHERGPDPPMRDR
jgi:hypothetical protein